MHKIRYKRYIAKLNNVIITESDIIKYARALLPDNTRIIYTQTHRHTDSHTHTHTHTHIYIYIYRLFHKFRNESAGCGDVGLSYMYIQNDK